MVWPLIAESEYNVQEEQNTVDNGQPGFCDSQLVRLSFEGVVESNSISPFLLKKVQN